MLIASLIAAALLAGPFQFVTDFQGTALKRGKPNSVADCNANGIPDEIEIAQGLVEDCQGDGIPDECQLAIEARYLHDDGIAEVPYGWGTPYYAWLSQFDVKAGAEVITEIEIGRGALTSPAPVFVGLWSDPDGNLDPTDAQPLVTVLTDLDWQSDLLRIDIPDTLVGPPGTSFFVGVVGAFPLGEQPLSVDFSTPSFRSWVIGSETPIEVDDLGGATSQPSYLTNSDWVLRALSCPTGHCGELKDQDFDGTPDACQEQDCNGNGVPDEQDIALGTSADCQGDGIPDECQTDPGAAVYAYDDGELSTAVGTGFDYYTWLTSFVVQPGGEVITDIEAAWGFMNAGTELTICIWSDPNGDGDPTDAQLIASYPALSSLEGSGQWVGVNIPDTFVGPAGTPFFLGVYGNFEFDPSLPIQYAAGLDTVDPDLKAWFVSSDLPIDLDDLSANAAEFGRLNTVCSCDGDWTLRAITCTTGHCLESSDLNQNSVPDDCEPDCNGNFVPDDLDILLGLSTDCNSDGIPDECQGLADCDGNGLPDLCQAVTPTGLAGEYYSSVDLSGDPVSRIDPQVDFDFSVDAPPADVWETDFSARWTGALRASVSGVYAVGLLHRGPVRLWVDGQLLLDDWYDSGSPVEVLNTIELVAGQEYHLRLEAVDVGGSTLRLRWQQPGDVVGTVPEAALRPVYDRDFDGVPDVCQLMADCNGNLVEDLDELVSGSAPDCDGNQQPDDCQPCEDRDGNGLLDACELLSGPGLVGQYFVLDGQSLEFGWRTSSRVDAQLAFDWGAGAPTGVLADRFGVRWTGTLTTPAVSGDYDLHLQVDDGGRLWLDGDLLIDAWDSAGTFSASVPLAASSEHLLRVEMRETGGDASVSLLWTVPGGVVDLVPSSALAPHTDLNGDGLPDVLTTDCNQNGVPDPLDIDLDGDCIPDDCQGGVGYWRFEEAGGSTAFDETANQLDGFLNSFPTRTSDVPVTVIPQTGARNTQALDNGFVGSVTVPDPGGVLSVPANSVTLEAWVKLIVLSNASSVNQRQWLFQKKPAASSDALLEYSLLVQAGNLGMTGRELAFRYGDETNVGVVISALSITDYEWHHVSVAYDADRLELRFGIDGVFETVPFEKPPVTNAGQLKLGAHENASAQENQWLYGFYDEPRVTRAFLPPERLLDHEP